VQSSVLVDGLGWLRSCSTRTVAAHFSIGLTGHHHRQSSVVRHRKGGGHRQRMACPCKRFSLMDITVCVNVCAASTSNVLPRWRYARSIPAKIHGLEWAIAWRQVCRTSIDCWAIYSRTTRRLFAARSLSLSAPTARTLVIPRQDLRQTSCGVPTRPRQFWPTYWPRRRQRHYALLLQGDRATMFPAMYCSLPNPVAPSGRRGCCGIISDRHPSSYVLFHYPSGFSSTLRTALAAGVER
jgi:hypothetical protein